MNSNDWYHGTPSSKIHRLKKRKRRQLVYQDKKNRKSASIGLVMKFMLVRGFGSISTHIMNQEMKAFNTALPNEQLPTDVNYSIGILSLGPDNFLSAAVTFCHDIAREARMPIVSVGSGDGSIERKIIEAYRERYGEGSSPNIILVDPNPHYNVHFKYVDELIEKRPDIVGHCAAFIIWPVPQPDNDGYDIDAIRKLQPHGVFTVYESTGSSGSQDFVHFLRDGNDLFRLPWTELGFANHEELAFEITEECESHGLDNYEVYEVAARKEYLGRFTGTFIKRMTIARRMDFQFVNVCPAINWTCKREELKFRKFVAKTLDEEGENVEDWSNSRDIMMVAKQFEFNLLNEGY